MLITKSESGLSAKVDLRRTIEPFSWVARNHILPFSALQSEEKAMRHPAVKARDVRQIISGHVDKTNPILKKYQKPIRVEMIIPIWFGG